MRDIRQILAKQAASARKRFLRSLEPDKARATQRALLERVVGSAATVFGREHSFDAIDDLAAYKKAVPIRHYEELRPWIDRAAEGEAGVLTAQEPIRFWKTTGTTSASKRIPVTPAAQSRFNESFMALQGTQLHYYPTLNERPDTVLMAHMSPKKVKEHLAGRPYCSTTEVPVEVRRGNESLLPPWALPLQDVVEDDAVRLYFLLCYTAAHDLQTICCLHPSRFQTITSALREATPRIIREIRDGTILDVPTREPDAERAARLEALAAQRADGALLPRDVWPSLRFVGSWSGSYITRYRPVMREAFCEAFLPMPSISSECFMTLTVDEDLIGQPLNIGSALFEFVPSEQDVKPDTRTLDFHELQQGQTYEVILTTLGGLYRYAMCDIFRVCGWVAGVPRLEYVGRRSVSDMTGEKLAEQQVADVVGAALAERGAASSTFTVCGVQGEHPRYFLLVESHEALVGRDDELAQAIDAQLKAVNSRYELKRNFNDLAPLSVELLSDGTFTKHRELQAQRGMAAGQVKHRVLQPVDGAALGELRELSGQSTASER